MADDRLGGDLLVVAGEASGDLHCARLVAELQLDMPGLRTFGLGGDELAAVGTELVARSAEISVVGITEVLRILPRAREIFRELLAEVDRRQTRAALLVDFPDFNLRLARALKRRGVKVLYYISPQVWAWRRGRVRLIRRLVDKMLVILPFEVEFYRRHGVAAVHVGHPLVDEVPQLTQSWEQEPPPQGPYAIALLPGSRASEIAANLPVMLAAAAELGRRIDCRFQLIKAPSVEMAAIRQEVERAGVAVEILQQDRFAAVAASHLAICASGTATLEVGLLGTPMVMVYRVSPWTYRLGRALVRLPHIALVNLVLEKRAVPELLQGEASATKIADSAAAILTDRDRIRRMRSDLGTLRARLGDSGASRRAAEQVRLEIAATPEVACG